MQRFIRILSIICILFCAMAAHAQSRQYVCAPGLLFCDDFNTAGEDVNRRRWRAPMAAEARRGRTMFRNSSDTPSLSKVRVENGMVRLTLSTHNPAHKSAPKKEEPKKEAPAKKLEQDPPADKKPVEKKAMDKTTLQTERMSLPGRSCTDTDEDKKTKPDTRMRPPEKKTMPANHPFLGSRLIAVKPFAPPGAYPYWSAVSFSMRARFPSAATMPAGLGYNFMLHRAFPPNGRSMPARNEIELLFASRNFNLPLEKRVLHANVLNNMSIMAEPERARMAAPLDFAAWHVYRMDWGPNYITWYIDGKRMKRVRNAFQRNEPMHLMLSAFAAKAMGAGGLSPAGDAASARNWHMEVDWVRAQRIGTSAVLHPMLKGRAADHCFMKGKHCGRMAADYYCQMKGFDQAGDWTLATRKLATTHPGTGKPCKGGDCRGFATVTCLGGMTERDGPMFRRPMVRHEGKQYRLDWCLSYGKQCGRPVAEAFCRMRGYAAVKGFATERYVSPTHVLDEKDRKICTGRICDGFKYIACGQ